jgi:two-component system cell cycle response regulator
MNRPTILLVDDTRLLLEIGKSFLESSPVRVLTAQNGEEGLALMKTELPDLVVLDQNMPKMTGAACCAAMRRDPALKGIPVIMISSACSREDLEEFGNAGCNDFMAKPLDRATFLGKVRRFLPGIERRGERVPCRMPVVMTAGGKTFSGMSMDLSRLYVASDEPVKPGEILAIRFFLPGETGDPAITARCRVAWINEGRKPSNPHYPAGCGLEFLEITGEGLSILRKNEIGTFLAAARAGKGGDAGR